MVTTEEFKKRQLHCIRKAAENCRKMVELNPNWSVPRWFERNQKRMNDIFLAQPPKENECNVWENVSVEEFMNEFYNPFSFNN